MPLASKHGAPRPDGKQDPCARTGNIQGRVAEHNPGTDYDPFVNTRRPERSFAKQKPKQFL